MSEYKGDFTTANTIYHLFNTFDSNDPSASVTLTGLAVTDIEIYKNGSVTQRSSEAGYTLLDTDGIDFDGTTGIHGFSVDLSDDDDSGFYSAGAEYTVVIASVTVDGATINFVAFSFSIERAGGALALLKGTNSLATIDGKIDAIPTTAMRGTDGALTDKAGFSLSATGLDAISQSAIGMIEIAKAIWDRLLTGATHNINNSAGKRLRQLAGSVYADGTAQTGGLNTITLASGESSTDDIYWQSYIAIVGGTGAGQGHHIISYNGTTKVAVLDDDWIVQPDNTSEYVILGSGSHDEYESGLARAGANGSITLESTAVSGTDILKNDCISIISGTGAHQARRITAYNGTTKVATVSPDWVTNPDATSGYWVTPKGRVDVGENNDKAGYSLSATGLDAISQAATGMIEIAKAVWDRIISKASHNIGQSAAKVLRQGGDLIQIDGVISDASPTTTDFDTNLTQIDGYFNDATLIFSNGSANAGIGKPVSVYVNANGNMTFLTTNAWPVTPVNGDDFVIIALHSHPISEMVDSIGARTPSAQTGAPTTYDGLLYFIREAFKNKLKYTKATDVMELFEDDGTTPKLTHAMTDDATEATRGEGV